MEEIFYKLLRKPICYVSNDINNVVYQKTDIVLLVFLPFLIQEFGIRSLYENVTSCVLLR